MQLLKNEPIPNKSHSNIRAILRLLGLAGYTFVLVSFMLVKSRLVKNPDLYFAKCTRLWCRMLTGIMGIETSSRGHVPDKGVLVVSNHRSYIDIAVIGQYFICSFMAKAELKTWPLLGWAATSSRTVFVQRDCPESRRQSRKEISKKLSNAISFIVFPEGTTTRTGLLPFKPGVFKTAVDNGMTVCPVAIEYDDPDAAWVDDDTFIRHFIKTFGKKRTYVTLTFGTLLSSTIDQKLMHDAREQIDFALNFKKETA